MEIKKPLFGLDVSPIDAATELHSFSRDMQSYYNVVHGHLIGKLDRCEDSAELSKLKAELQVVNQKLAYFKVLNNAASTANVVLHTPDMIEELGTVK
ncbi:MAG: hypothetical protein AAGG02_07435 [Cyanobacteria bacterium P01_H01_bin.15]